jgi:hypothetical protein
MGGRFQRRVRRGQGRPHPSVWPMLALALAGVCAATLALSWAVGVRQARLRDLRNEMERYDSASQARQPGATTDTPAPGDPRTHEPWPPRRR